MTQTNSPIACNLGALDRDEQRRRAELARAVVGHAAATTETSDGYALRFDDDPVLLRDAIDWIRLERRCCPFLRFELTFDPENGPLWLRLGGGPGVKEFLSANGLAARG
jgi:hypothetical protein